MAMSVCILGRGIEEVKKGDLLLWEGKNRFFCAKLELKFVHLILVSMQNYSETGVIEHLKKDITFST